MYAFEYLIFIESLADVKPAKAEALFALMLVFLLIFMQTCIQQAGKIINVKGGMRAESWGISWDRGSRGNPTCIVVGRFANQ